MGGDGGKRTMQIKPSRFEWERFKDDLVRKSLHLNLSDILRKPVLSATISNKPVNSASEAASQKLGSM